MYEYVTNYAKQLSGLDVVHTWQVVRLHFHVVSCRISRRLMPVSPYSHRPRAYNEDNNTHLTWKMGL
jgi:hypothetical protein